MGNFYNYRYRNLGAPMATATLAYLPIHGHVHETAGLERRL